MACIDLTEHDQGFGLEDGVVGTLSGVAGFFEQWECPFGILGQGRENTVVVQGVAKSRHLGCGAIAGDAASQGEGVEGS